MSIPLQAFPQALVWLPADHRLLGKEGQQTPFLVLGDKYARAVKQCAGAQPVLFPLADAGQIPALLGLVDGVMLTGSASNVHPSHFDEKVLDAALPLDPQRDALTLALVRACQACGVPLLGICRGFQEINVALGGSLEQSVHDREGRFDHRDPEGVSLDEAYGPAHEVRFVPGSAFAGWAGAETAQVNSLHGQGIARLASGLRALGHSPDGLIEAFEIEGAATFAYAVQWHPEWNCQDNPFYRAILAAFGQACQRRHASRTRQQGAPAA
ncbi:gamma-glutamyl-gamma-aminobutyrate hydrolase family protein [Polaromonas sp.]|uniref:gamma-glutamyl-gamma-aminobutyrate hydrolase family protein n=1 Tax=Polaromonas sp. TaxID=1869339 RepID=UPI003BB56D49